jgi:hypothetical protein
VTGEKEPTDSHYQSDIVDSFHALPNLVRWLLGGIQALTLPEDLNLTGPQYLIFVIDGSVLFDVGYHHCLVSTTDEEIILSGDRTVQCRTTAHGIISYRSTLGGGVCRDSGSWKYGPIRTN